MLQIHTLGGLQTTINGKQVAFVARRAEVLLAYLALNQHTHERETIANLLWDDRTQKQTMANLRSLLAQMPKAVKPYLEMTRKTIGVRKDEGGGIKDEKNGEPTVWVDALEFETPTSPLLVSLSLYKGNFLSGIFLSDSRGLEEWIAVTRERLQQVALSGHEQAATAALHQRRFVDGVAHAQAMVMIDPLRESAQRLLLRLLARSGQYNDALLAYQKYEALLDEELGIRPMPATQQLVQRIRQARKGLVHRVPQPDTPLIGRDQLLESISRQLDSADCRLLTLTGVGGVGKTRLALQTAHNLRGDYLNGIVMVQLAGLSAASSEQSVKQAETTPATITDAIANTCDLTLSSQQPIDQLCDYLRDKEMLLILDNCEHIIEPLSDLLLRILEATSQITLLATSRERLWLAAEQVQPLSGLSYDTQDEAIALFVERLQRSGFPFDLNERTLPIVKHICALTDGLPLAIELAATTGQPMQVMADQIANSLDALTNRMRGTPNRHRSLRAVFDYSWALLSPQLQAVMAQLSLLRNPFDLAAASTIANASAHDLQQLQSKSLLQLGEDARYTLHPMVRQYAGEELGEVSQADRSRYVTHFTNWLAQQLSHLLGEQQSATLAQLVLLRDDALQAGRWAVTTQQFDKLQQAIEPIFRFFAIRARYNDGLSYFEQWVAQLATTATASTTADYLTALMRSRLAWFTHRVGSYDQAEQLYEQMAAWFEQMGHREDYIFCLIGQSEILQYRGDVEQSLATTQRALLLSESIGHQPHQASLHGIIGRIAQDAGDYPTARQHYEQCLSLNEQIGNPQQHAFAINSVGTLAGSTGDYATARTAFERAQTLTEQIGDAMGLTRATMNLSTLAYFAEDYAAAHQLRERGLAVCQDIGFRWGVASALRGLGDVARKLKQYDAAQRYYADSLTMWQQVDDQRSLGLAKISYGSLLFELGKLGQSWQQQGEAIEIGLRIGTQPVALVGLQGWGTILRARGDVEEALRIYLFVAAHPATEQQTLSFTEDAIEEMSEEVSAESLKSLQQNATALALQPDGLNQIITAVANLKQ